MNSEELQSSIAEDAQINEDSTQPTKKKHCLRKILCIFVGLGLIIVCAPSLLGIVFHDIPSADDDDLQINVILVPKDENAYYDLLEISSDVEDGKLLSEHLNGDVWNQKFVDEILLKNKDSLDIFSIAASKPKYQDPISSDPSKFSCSDELPPLNTWNSISRVKVLQAMDLSKKGKDKQAFKEALVSIYVGQKIQNSQTFSMEYLMAIMIKSKGLVVLQKITASSSLSRDELKEHTKELNKFYENETGAVTALKVEYQSLAKAIDMLALGDEEILTHMSLDDHAGLVEKSFYFQPNKTKNFFAQNMRIDIGNVLKSCSEVRDITDDERKVSTVIPPRLTENAIGKILYDVYGASMASFTEKVCEEDTLIASVQLLIALKVYSIDNDKLPQTLDQLVPRYVYEIPTDPYSEEYLKYSPSKKIIYSVGRDREDNGGDTEKDIVYDIIF